MLVNTGFGFVICDHNDLSIVSLLVRWLWKDNSDPAFSYRVVILQPSVALLHSLVFEALAPHGAVTVFIGELTRPVWFWSARWASIWGRGKWWRRSLRKAFRQISQDFASFKNLKTSHELKTLSHKSARLQSTGPSWSRGRWCRPWRCWRTSKTAFSTLKTYS